MHKVLFLFFKVRGLKQTTEKDAGNVSLKRSWNVASNDDESRIQQNKWRKSDESTGLRENSDSDSEENENEEFYFDKSEDLTNVPVEYMLDMVTNSNI